MRFVIFLSGAAIFLIGIAGVVGIIPLSVLNTVTISQPNINCNTPCSATFTITNNNATSNFAVYMKVTNAAYQAIWLNTIQVASSSGTVNVNQLSIGTLPPGAYIFSTFAVSNYGVVLSGTTSQAFNVGGNYNLVIDPYNPATGTISVVPSCSINAASQSICPYPVGTPVSITYAPQSNYAISQWCLFSQAKCIPPGTGLNQFVNGVPQASSAPNPLKLIMNATYEVSLSVAQPNVQYFTMTPRVSITGCSFTGGIAGCGVLGTVSPVGSIKVYQSSAFGPISTVFTAAPTNANSTFQNWQVSGKNLTKNPVNMNYTFLQTLQSSGQVDFPLYAYFKQKVFYQLGVGAYAGISTVPVAKVGGTYTYPAGASVTITIAAVATNVCFTGWIVDGNQAGTGNSVQVTMNSYHSVFAQGVGKPATGCGSPPPPPCSNCSGSVIPYIFLGVGGLVMALGVRRKR